MFLLGVVVGDRTFVPGGGESSSSNFRWGGINSAPTEFVGGSGGESLFPHGSGSGSTCIYSARYLYEAHAISRSIRTTR